MRRRTLLPAVPALAFLLALPLMAQQAAFVVRHAEKASESNDPPVPLSQTGAARARRLAVLLRNAGIAEIYSTDFVRTRATAAPLAEALKLPIRIYAAKDALGKPTAGPLLDQLTRRGRNEVVLIVGHSDNVPVILKGLGCEQEIAIAGNEYDNLFVVVPRGSGPPLLLRLQY
jgi:phosphohistidine phosphatase SixA